MKKLVSLFIFILLSTAAIAGHIAGGEMYYRYLGAGSTANTLRYQITLRLFRECNPPPGQGGTQIASMPTSVTIGIFNNTGPGTIFTSRNVNRTNLDQITLSSPSPCIVNAPQVCYQVGNFTIDIDLPISANGYVASFQTCCRTNGIANISGASVGGTYSAVIPPTSGPNAINNSSAVFQLKDTTLVCKDLDFTLDFGANDPDRDSLSYAFCAAFDGGSAVDAGAIVPSVPPYNSIGYSNPFSGASPLGPNVTLNPRTGLISGRAPGAGSYAINVCVSEFRNGKLINVHRKDFTLKIGNCSLTEAKLPQPGYNTICDSFSFTFENLSSSSNISNYFWDFYDPASGRSTSTDPKPTHVYSDTGTYQIKLRVQSSSGCTDSSTSVVRVYPGFFPGFDIAGSCFLSPFQFTDKSRTNHGTVNKWRWNFGDPATLADTSLLRNSTYKYPAINQHTVELIVGSSKGCLDTITKTISVTDLPSLQLPFKDTLICSIDTLRLQAVGTGSFTWGPAYNIINSASASPSVYPKTTTSYVVTLNENGCVNSDTIKVNVLDFITVNAGRDTSMCVGDSIVLRPQSQGLRYFWSPTAGLSDPTSKSPVVRTTTTANYTVTVNLGKCQSSDQVAVKVAPYPFANAGADTTVCFGNPATLNANITGSSFIWSPSASLQNSNTLNPVALPGSTTRYVLTVFDTLGCPKPFSDTLFVRVITPIRAFAGNDTIIVANQPLQLNATGGSLFQWLTTTGMSNPFIPNPLVTLGPGVDSVRYVVRVSEAAGCFGTDDIVVRVFKTGPDLFIPSAFTPNNDGRNDILKPVAVGMKGLTFFRIYNRWGQMLFSTSEIGRGWNGTFGGYDQPSGTYVYMAEAVDYLDKKVTKKGTVVLLR